MTLTDDRGSLQSGQCGKDGKFYHLKQPLLFEADNGTWEFRVTYHFLLEMEAKDQSGVSWRARNPGGFIQDTKFSPLSRP